MLRIKNYLKYIIQEIIFFVNILWYIFINPSYIPLIIKYSRRIPGITLKNKIPWLTFSSIKWLETNINNKMIVFEWGSGGSTLFFASRVKKITSVEHDNEWFKDVSLKIKEYHIDNCEYSILPPAKEGVDEKKMYMEYSQCIRKYPNEYFDLIIIDGKVRNECIIEAMPKVKHGGFILLDNSERREYEPGIEYLKNWKRKDFYGPGPYNHYFSKTSIFTKPKKY